MAQPLRALLRKERNPKKDWGRKQDQAVIDIENSFLNDVLLVHFDNSRQTVLTTDASDHALGAVLSQIVEGEERPVCFLSKTMDRHQVNNTLTEKECLAVVWATENF